MRALRPDSGALAQAPVYTVASPVKRGGARCALGSTRPRRPFSAELRDSSELMAVSLSNTRKAVGALSNIGRVCLIGPKWRQHPCPFDVSRLRPAQMGLRNPVRAIQERSRAVGGPAGGSPPDAHPSVPPTATSPPKSRRRPADPCIALTSSSQHTAARTPRRSRRHRTHPFVIGRQLFVSARH